MVAEDKLVLAPVARALSSRGPLHGARDRRAGRRRRSSFLAASRRALGLPGRRTPTSASTARRTSRRRGSARCTASAGFDDEDALEVARVLGQGMARYAEATRALVARTFIEPGLDEYELAHRYRAVAEQLMPLAGPWLEHVFALHLQQVLRSDALTQEQRRAGKLDDTQDAVIAFADLVGFTELGESVPVEELGSVAGRLSRLAGEALRAAGEAREADRRRGDARLARARADARRARCGWSSCAAEDAAFPPLRAGIACGQAVHRWGDWFGTPVNLASRLTTRARPSTVLVSEEVRDAVGERLRLLRRRAARSSRASRRRCTPTAPEGPAMQRQQRLGADPDRRLAPGARVADEPVRLGQRADVGLTASDARSRARPRPPGPGRRTPSTARWAPRRGSAGSRRCGALLAGEERRRLRRAAAVRRPASFSACSGGGGVVDPARPAAADVEAAVGVLVALDPARRAADRARRALDARAAQREDRERRVAHVAVEGAVAAAVAHDRRRSGRGRRSSAGPGPRRGRRARCARRRRARSARAGRA